MKIAIIGSGSIARRHYSNIKKLKPSSEILIYTRPLNIQSKKKLFGDNVNFVSELDEVIKFSPLIAVICSPASLHIEQSLRLSEENINLFIEKPLSNKVSGIETLLMKTKNNKTINMVGYPLRFNSSLLFFREKAQAILSDSEINIRSECYSYLPDWRPDVDYRKSVSSNKSLGGGALLELSHEIDYLKWTFGKLSLIESNIQNKGILDIDVEDSADLFLEVNQNRKIKIELSIDFSSNILRRECLLSSETNELKWDGINNKVLSRDKKISDDWKVEFEDDEDDMFFEEIRYYMNCVSSKTIAEPSITDALETLNIIHEAKGE